MRAVESRFQLKRIPWVTILLTGALVLGAVLPEPVKETLSFGDGFQKEGKWWQAVTCHFVHFGSGHLWRDLPPFILLGWIVESDQRIALITVLAIAGFAVPAAVLFWEPNILPYRGVSGLSFALFAWLASNIVLRRDSGRLFRLMGLLGLVALAAKLWLDLTGRRFLPSEPGDSIVISWSAHLAGAVVGLILSLIHIAYISPKTNR